MRDAVETALSVYVLAGATGWALLLVEVAWWLKEQAWAGLAARMGVPYRRRDLWP